MKTIYGCSVNTTHIERGLVIIIIIIELIVRQFQAQMENNRSVQKVRKINGCGKN